MTLKRMILMMLSLAAIGALLFGCYTGQTNLSDSTESPSTWSLMKYDQRLAHMRNAVLPVAQEVFGAWRPEKHSRVDCSLCHGAGVDMGNFSMPSTDLIRLSGRLLLGPELKNHGDTTRLKLDRLVPPMAQALNKGRFNILTRKGFGCYSCHLGPAGPMFGN
jgi:hypothetical protein